MRLWMLWLLVLLLFVGGRTLAGWPDGVDRDENQNVWNARCLAEAGTDFRARPYPLILVDYGDDKHALFAYLLAAGEALGIAMRPERSRFLSVLLTALGALLAGLAFARCRSARPEGLWLFALLAFLPWLQVGPCLGWECATSLPGYATMLLGLVLVRERARRGVGMALFVLGLAFAGYGYPAAKLLAPILLAAACLCVFRGTRERLVVIGLVALVFAPLALDHLLHPEHTDRGRGLSVFTLPLGEALATFCRTYAMHYSPQLLWLEGDLHPRHFAGLLGLLPLAALPALLALVITALRRRVFWPSGPVDRFVFVCLLVYPLPAALTRDGLAVDGGNGHVLRTLLGALAWTWFTVRGLGLVRRWRPIWAHVLLALCLAQSAAHLVHLHLVWRTAEATRAEFHGRLYHELRAMRARLQPSRVFVSPLPAPGRSAFPYLHFYWTAFDAVPIPGPVDPLTGHLRTRGPVQVELWIPPAPPPAREGQRDVLLLVAGSPVPEGFDTPVQLEGRLFYSLRSGD